MSVAALPGVTLLGVDTVNHALALRALDLSRRDLAFARVLLITDRVPPDVTVPPGIDVATIAPLGSREAYSQFMLKSLAPFVATPHALVVQWDGYVANATAWDPAFLDCDYIGAKWFWQPPGFRVGNGGFSLRSRRLLDALADPRIVLAETEDLTIGHAFRPLLEAEYGIRYADEAAADRFAFEADYPIGRPFGFHGLFNFARVVPEDELAALALRFSDAIARSPQMLQLVKNAIAQGAWRAAVALAERRCAASPADAESAALLAHARAQGAAAPVAARNDPCPCGSGKRYKHCHGAVGAGAVAPPSADALAQRGLDLHRRGDLAGAEREYRAALASAPDHAPALHYLGVLLYQRGRLDEALPLVERGAALRPGEPEFQNNVGLVLAALGRHDDAAEAYRRALAQRPDHAIAWSNLGLALAAQNALPEAIGAYDRALAIAPDYGEAQWNRALARLKHGEWRAGFADYERRLELPAFRGLPAPTTPRWRGEALAGRTLLVVAEQGLGDAIHFLRFAQVLAERGARVVADVPRALARLAATVPGVAAVIPRGDPWPPHDCWSPLLSVPGVLGLTAPPETAHVPYMTADAARCVQVAASLASAVPRRPRIGLAWAGARANTLDRERSCPLAQIGPLLARDDVAWVSLQKGDGEEEIAQVAAAARLALPDARNDLDGTAALIAALDLVVSVDTSLAHLAGALARPVWILLPFACDWRWGERGATTPWYPTARLFRPSRYGDWASVVGDVGAALDRPEITGAFR